MRVRYKTYLEFIAEIKIARRLLGGQLITCKKRYVLIKSNHALWNSPGTRKSFLWKLYIEQVLQAKNVSEKILRIPGYELLGKRCTRRGDTLIIAATREVVDTATGEVDEDMLVKNITNPFRVTPYKILKSKVQL